MIADTLPGATRRRDDDLKGHIRCGPQGTSPAGSLQDQLSGRSSVQPAGRTGLEPASVTRAGGFWLAGTLSSRAVMTRRATSFNRGAHPVEDEPLREDPHRDRHHDQRHGDDDLAQVHVGQPLPGLALAQEDALDGPEDVAGRQDHGRGGQDGQTGSVVERGQDHEDLGHEPAEAGQAHRAEENHVRHRAVQRHDVVEPAQLVQVAGMGPIVDHADQEEHPGRGDPMRQHHEHRAVDPVGVVSPVLRRSRAGGSSRPCRG